MDSWNTWGDEPVEVSLVVRGHVGYLDATGEVTASFDAKTIEAAYRAFRETR